MKQAAKCILRYSGVFILLLIIFNLCLYASCLFSSDLLKNHAEESAKILKRQGERYELSKAFDICNDNYNDAVIINELFSVDSQEPYSSYMKSRKNYSRTATQYEILDGNGNATSAIYLEKEKRIVLNFAPIQELQDHLNGKLPLSYNYGKYWHGYIALFRPLLLLFNLSQIRFLLISAYTVLFFYFCHLVNMRFGKITTIIFASSLVCTGYFSSAFSLASSPVFLIMMISAIVLIKHIDKIQNFHLFVFTIACITNFVDILTVPMITLGMLSCLYLLKQIEDGNNWQFCLKTAALSSAVWFIGYGGTWLCKWIMYDFTVNTDACVFMTYAQTGPDRTVQMTKADNFSLLAIAIKQILFRISRTNSDAGIDVGKHFSITLNILGRASLYTLITTGIILYMHRFKIAVAGFNKTALSFLLIAFLPAIWYIALANHTEMHFFFTYRQSFMFMLGLLLVINEILFAKNTKSISGRHDG